MLSSSTVSSTAHNKNSSFQKPPSVRKERDRIRRALIDDECTIDEAIEAAKQFATTPGINDCGLQLVTTLTRLKPFLLRVDTGSSLYVRFVCLSLRSSNARLPNETDFYKPSGK